MLSRQMKSVHIYIDLSSFASLAEAFARGDTLGHALQRHRGALDQVTFDSVTSARNWTSCWVISIDLRTRRSQMACNSQDAAPSLLLCASMRKA